jgi:hypothetical protein
MFRALFVNHAYNTLSCRRTGGTGHSALFGHVIGNRLGGRKNVHTAIPDDEVIIIFNCAVQGYIPGYIQGYIQGYFQGENKVSSVSLVLKHKRILHPQRDSNSRTTFTTSSSTLS